MDINLNNSLINTFSGGLDTDTSDALIKPDHYRMARNVHYITDKDSNSGELRVINGVLKSNKAADRYKDKIILGTASVDNIGVIVYENTGTKTWGVDKLMNPYKDVIPTDTSTLDFNIQPIVLNCPDPIGNNYKNKLSCLLNYESDKNVKLYIADGQHYVLAVNIMRQYKPGVGIGEFESIPEVALSQPTFNGIIAGNIKGPVVQYAYLLYNKYGQQTEMSPVTGLISLPLDKPKNGQNGKKIKGVSVELSTNCGVSLSFEVPEDSIFDRIKIYRISYVQNGLPPVVEMIYDDQYVHKDKVEETIPDAPDRPDIDIPDGPDTPDNPNLSDEPSDIDKPDEPDEPTQPDQPTSDATYTVDFPSGTYKIESYTVPTSKTLYYGRNILISFNKKVSVYNPSAKWSRTYKTGEEYPAAQSFNNIGDLYVGSLNKNIPGNKDLKDTEVCIVAKITGKSGYTYIYGISEGCFTFEDGTKSPAITLKYVIE